MKNQFLFRPCSKLIYTGTILFICSLFVNGSCNKPPYEYPHKNIKGFVITKEVCNTNVENDYWLLDMTLVANTPQVGDTIIVGGVTYKNVLKTKDLASQLKQIGIKVSMDYNTITPNKIQTTNCNVTNPETYLLKEISIIYQGRIP